MLAHFMYQINQDRSRPSGWKTGKPCKIAYVGEKVTLDSRHIKEFRNRHPKKYSKEKRMIQDALGMPSLHSPDVPPNYETGNTYKPYVYIDGEVEIDGSDMTVTIGTRQKSTYENGKVTDSFKGDLACKIVMDGYVYEGMVVGKEYAAGKIFRTPSQTDIKGRLLINGMVSEKTMNDICKSVFDLCKKNLQGIFDKDNNIAGLDKNNRKKKTKETLSFRILVLPDSAKNSVVTYAKSSGAPIGTDSFQNEYSKIPSRVHKSATYATIDDMSYMLNPTSASKETGELVRYWGSHPTIGDVTFEKIGINLDRDFYYLGGFMWYFGNHDTKFTRERHAQDDGTEEIGSYRGEFRHGFWHQMYEGMKQASSADRPGLEMVVICAQRLSIARIEIVLSESVTAASLQKSLLVNGASLEESGFQESDAYHAMEVVILNDSKTSDTKPDWHLYMEAVADILGGRKMARGRLVRHITANFRDRYTKEKWKLTKNKRKASEFLNKARFAVAGLAEPLGVNVEMDAAEEYAHRMGRLVGAYAKFSNVKNLIELSLQPGTTCDGHMLRRIFDDIAKKLSLSARSAALHGMILDVKRHMPSKEMAPEDIRRDLTLHFYMGLFREL